VSREKRLTVVLLAGMNQAGGVVAGALPPLYGMAGKIVTDVTPGPEQPAVPEPARPASSTRRGRCIRG